MESSVLTHYHHNGWARVEKEGSARTGAQCDLDLGLRRKPGGLISGGIVIIDLLGDILVPNVRFVDLLELLDGFFFFAHLFQD